MATAAQSTPTKRYFEFVEGKSSKFWEVWVSGNDLTTHWGRIGTDGQSKTKTFTTPAAAQAEYDELVSEKVRKGYREIVTNDSVRTNRDQNTSASPTAENHEVASAQIPPAAEVAAHDEAAPEPPQQRVRHHRARQLLRRGDRLHPQRRR